MKLSHTETVVTDYSLDDIIRHVTKKSPETEQCLRVLTDTIKANRFEILGTFDGFEIITNGYGEFKHIETSGDLSSKKIISKSTIFNNLASL